MEPRERRMGHKTLPVSYPSHYYVRTLCAQRFSKILIRHYILIILQVHRSAIYFRQAKRWPIVTRHLVIGTVRKLLCCTATYVGVCSGQVHTLSLLSKVMMMIITEGMYRMLLLLLFLMMAARNTHDRVGKTEIGVFGPYRRYFYPFFFFLHTPIEWVFGAKKGLKYRIKKKPKQNKNCHLVCNSNYHCTYMVAGGINFFPSHINCFFFFIYFILMLAHQYTCITLSKIEKCLNVI